MAANALDLPPGFKFQPPAAAAGVLLPPPLDLDLDFDADCVVGDVDAWYEQRSARLDAALDDPEKREALLSYVMGASVEEMERRGHAVVDRLDQRGELAAFLDDAGCREGYDHRAALAEALDQKDMEEERTRIENGEQLRCEVRRLEEAVGRARASVGDPPFVVGHLVEVVGDDHAVVEVSGDDPGRLYYVPILGDVDRGLLKPPATVVLHMGSHALLGVLPPADDAGSAAQFVVAEADRPDVTYDDIAGCDQQKREVREAVELPLTHPELFAQVGVDPPRGVLLHGPPGTGKTMLAKAVAHHALSAFIRVSAGELVQKRLGEGPRMVREVFQLARAMAPAIVFIDEVDAVAAARSDDAGATGADREVHRVLMELLAQMDGFDESTGVAVIMATNRADALDPALLRPGRIDRTVEFPHAGREQKRQVFDACTAGMSLAGDAGLELEELAARHDTMSAAEIAAVCREAGMRAIRGGRHVVTREDFHEGYRAVVKESQGGADEFAFYT